MKTLKDHVILYDAVCPMCDLYTHGFVKAGMLDKTGRLPYQNTPANLACTVDQKRSVNEIALVHIPTGKAYYGVESLMKILGHSLPIFRPLFQCKPFVKIADKLYKFISFNRRVIVPPKKEEVRDPSLEPAFHTKYRIAYLIFTWVLTSFILYKYSIRLNAILPQSNAYREFLVCGGQVIWQLAAVRKLGREKSWNYLGNMMTISFAGALALFLIMILGKAFLLYNAFVYASLFGLVVGLMFLEHIRRVKLLGLSWKLTASWVTYRVIILLFLLILHHV